MWINMVISRCMWSNRKLFFNLILSVLRKIIETEAYKHTTIKVGKDLQDHLVQPSDYDRYHPLNHVPKHQVQLFLEHPQGLYLHDLPGQLIPMPDCSFWEEMSPNFQPKPPLAQLEGIPSSPITSYLWEEADPFVRRTRVLGHTRACYRTGISDCCRSLDAEITSTLAMSNPSQFPLPALWRL